MGEVGVTPRGKTPDITGCDRSGKPRGTESSESGVTAGLILKGVGSFYTVLTGDGLVTCRPRGRFRREGISPLPGDHVMISRADAHSGRLDEILPRRNRFIRPPMANLETLVIVGSAATPVSDPYLLDRMCALAHLRNCRIVMVFNKWDLENADRMFEIYRKAGYPTIAASAETGQGLDELREAVAGQVVAFAGNSGVGKSSLITALSPELALPVGEVSEKLGRGRHTTRHVELFPFMGGYLADTPGFAAFDPNQTDDLTEIIFPEFDKYVPDCRFDDCRHLDEPGCGVLAAVECGEIPPSRHKSYRRLREELDSRPAY